MQSDKFNLQRFNVALTNYVKSYRNNTVKENRRNHQGKRRGDPNRITTATKSELKQVRNIG